MDDVLDANADWKGIIEAPYKLTILINKEYHNIIDMIVEYTVFDMF